MPPPRRRDMKLPADYREFLLDVGNGGAAFYGIFRLGEWDGAGGGEPWEASIIGDPSKPFLTRARGTSRATTLQPRATTTQFGTQPSEKRHQISPKVGDARLRRLQ